MRWQMFDKSQNFPQKFTQAQVFAKTSFGPVELIHVPTILHRADFHSKLQEEINK